MSTESRKGLGSGKREGAVLFHSLLEKFSVNSRNDYGLEVNCCNVGSYYFVKCGRSLRCFLKFLFFLAVSNDITHSAEPFTTESYTKEPDTREPGMSLISNDKP